MKSLERLPENKYGFNAVYHLRGNSTYKGKAEHVILVRNTNQIAAAETVRADMFDGKIVDVVVCKNPDRQRERIGDKATIYTNLGKSAVEKLKKERPIILRARF